MLILEDASTTVTLSCAAAVELRTVSKLCLSRTLIALACFSLIGGHWAVLQSVAWAKMLQSYSTQGSFSSALEKTFNGKNPCSLCQKIAQEKKHEKKREGTLETLNKKTIGILAELPLLPSPILKKFSYPRIDNLLVTTLTTRPPLPPS